MCSKLRNQVFEWVTDLERQTVFRSQESSCTRFKWPSGPIRVDPSRPEKGLGPPHKIDIFAAKTSLFPCVAEKHPMCQIGVSRVSNLSKRCPRLYLFLHAPPTLDVSRLILTRTRRILWAGLLNFPHFWRFGGGGGPSWPLCKNHSFIYTN